MTTDQLEQAKARILAAINREMGQFTVAQDMIDLADWLNEQTWFPVYTGDDDATVQLDAPLSRTSQDTDEYRP